MVFGLFKKKKQQVQSNQEKYLHLTVSNVSQETKDAVRVEFDWPEGGMHYKPGQFLTLILPVNGQKVRRAYSLSTSPYIDEKPAVVVKRVAGGLVSNHINDHVRVGDKVEVMPPMGNFTPEISEDNRRHLVLISGGSGITPIFGILKSVLKAETSSMVTLIYANRDADSIIYEAKLADIKAQYHSRFNYIQSLDNAPQGWKGGSGILNLKRMKTLIAALPDWNAEATRYYVCGPQGLMDLSFEAFEALKLNPKQTFKESFVATNNSPDPAIASGKIMGEGEGSNVKIKFEGQEYDFVVPAGKTILETALSQDIDLPYSCQSGLCTACMGKCLSGQVDLSDAEALSDEEREEGFVLTCVGKPLSENLVIEI